MRQGGRCEPINFIRTPMGGVCPGPGQAPAMGKPLPVVLEVSCFVDGI